MGRTLSEKLAQLPRARREKIQQRVAELVAEEMSLRELRHALYLAKMGGKLALVAEFPDRKPVKIKGLGEIAAPTTRHRNTRRRHARCESRGASSLA